MIQTILMAIAVFLIVLGIMSFTEKTIAFKETPWMNAKGEMIKKSVYFTFELISLTMGLSYLIWYCN